MAQRMSIYLPDEDADKLTNLAESENRSISNMVSELLKRYYNARVTTLPRPADGQVVPVVVIEPGEEK